MSLNLKTLGANVQQIRKRKQFKQEELAFRVGISRNYLSMVENGKKEISITYLVEIAEILECTVNDLLIGIQSHDNSDTSKVIEDILSDCNPTERLIIIETCISIKESLVKYREELRWDLRYWV